MNDCRSCRHSIGMNGVWLWCKRNECEARVRCEWFEYEPGTDAEEQSSAPISDPPRWAVVAYTQHPNSRKASWKTS